MENTAAGRCGAEEEQQRPSRGGAQYKASIEEGGRRLRRGWRSECCALWPVPCKSGVSINAVRHSSGPLYSGGPCDSDEPLAVLFDFKTRFASSWAVLPLSPPTARLVRVPLTSVCDALSLSLAGWKL